MLKKVSNYVAKWHMLEKGDKVIAGVSGGADSVCLLFVLTELQKSIPFEIIVVHVNHGLRGASADADEKYVKQLCKEKNILCVTYLENVELIAKKRKQSIEEAGREVRREAFRQTMKKYGATKIATAHHKNDNVETFFMNLVRGTGLKGLGGIKPIADSVIRPLLCLERREIEQFLKEQHISYCTDETNASDKYARNRLRNHMIPFLEKEMNPCAVSHINETMEQLRDVQEFMEEQRNAYLREALVVRDENQRKAYVILENVYQKIPKVFQPIVLKEALVLTAGQEKDLTSVHVNALLDLFEKQVGRKLDLPYQMKAERVYEGISLQKEMLSAPKEQECIFEPISFENTKEKTFVLSSMQITCRLLEKDGINGTFPQKSNTKCFDYDIIKNGLYVRTRKPGDYITIHPDGKTQKLKSYFINEKIPQRDRDKILLIADGSHILWIVGYRTNCIYQPGRNTKHVLEIQIDSKE